MWYKKYLFPIIVFFISMGLISNFTISHINSEKETQESTKKDPKPKPATFLDLNDKDAMDEIFRKIENYKSLESNQIRHLTLSEIEEEKNLNKLRNLDDDNIFENVGLIEPIANIYYLSSWIYKTMKQFSSNIVLYPYYFTYEVKNEVNESETINKKYEQGAYVSLNSTELDFFGNIGLKTNGTFSTKKAKAVFAADFAILSIHYSKGYYDEESFQDGVDWSSYFSAYSRGITYATYEEFLEQKEKDTSKTYVTKINETEVINGNLLNEDGLPRFGILIIPDYQLGTDSIILSKLGDTGKENIKKFYEKGGKIIVDGKSGTLLEDLGLMTSGVYDRNKLLSMNNVNRKVKTKGCENTFNKLYNSEDDDFEKQMVCLTFNEKKPITLATSFKTLKKADGYSTLMELDSNEELLVTTNVNDGLTYKLTEEEKKYNPLILFTKNKKNGQIFVLNYNPVHEGGDRNIVLNVIALLLSKDLYLTSIVKMNHNSDNNKDIPIPAGEFDYNLQVNILIHNLNDKEMKNGILYIFLPDNFAWGEIPSNCTQKAYNDGIPSSVSQRKTFENENDYLYCDFGTIEKYHKTLLDVYITVLNYKATQSKYQVLLLEPIFTYKDSNNEENLLFDQIKTNCEAAALIRTSLNPDPSSFYPLRGIGDYVDNVLKIENKEETLAYEVEYYALIPLISPLVDGCDQSKTTWTLQLYVDYYNTLHNYEVPLNSTDALDYIYPSELKGKSSVIASEWDSPVLPTKELYDGDESEKVGEGITEIKNINNGLITITSTTEVIKQINYRISDRFYKLASQRLMVFIDTTTKDGAEAIYKGEIPDDIKDPKYNDRTKVDFLYSRLDIFFYNNSNYYNPGDASQKLVFSVDKYLKYDESDENCAEKFGQASSKKIVEGYFTNFDEDKKKTILKPNEYSNALFNYCDLTLINPTEEEKIDIGNNGDYKLIHYIIPNVEKNITQPDQLYNFTKINEYYGYHKKYPSIKFLYLHSLEYTIKTEYCKYGGKMKIILGDYKIKSTDNITISPDHIAVYKTEYEEKANNNTITIYFKRGLMSNEQFGKNCKIRINIENLMKNNVFVHENQTFTFILEELKYDISSPETEYEKYYEILSEQVDFYYMSAFSYPALEIVAKMDRELNGYETLEPFNRYGLYIQELWHRTLYAPAENHHETDPGVTGSGDGYSVISNLGTSSIPMIEYMSVGSGQVIPAGPSTSRVSWKDVWGRQWQQPLRSVFPDIPPVPPPLKNFMMTTTYEIIRNGKQIYDWVSDEDVLVHLHIKLLNNYPKYFEITRCKENEIRFVPYNMFESHDREYENKSSANLTEEELNGDKMFLRQGGMASYGVCFSDNRAYVSGNKVDDELLGQIKQARLCADYTDATKIKECAEKLKDIKTISKAPDNYTDYWNYSPLVEEYYPQGYIETDMWQMTHIDYDDDPMDKAYKYHCDNILPNYDSFDSRFESPDIIKPQNSISIPLYKGLGYNLVYNKTTEMNYHGNTKAGWWSDNLQNKDDTLLAGRNECHNISVNETSKIVWVDGVDLVGSNRDGSNEAAKKIIRNKQKNIYTCLFNRKRPQYKPNSGKSFHPRNVVENNIIPIIADLDRYDDRLTDYNCTGYQYSPDNISTFEENYLETPTSKDYLYFGANLRGHAKETLNILVNLLKFDKIKYEGDVKINEGGRFVYWNPVNGPNSFLVVDDPVHIIKGKRNDIDIENNLFPLELKTFNSILYHTYTFKDEIKINSEWPYTTYYTNSYGYGDFAIGVYVGGVRKSKPVLQINGTTYARIIFYNNCGFDLNLYANAIEFEDRGSEPINADDLLKNITHSIRAPTKYNFLSYEIEEPYGKYISIEPSDHNIDVAPEFFDFENINVATIRDGFKGEYSLKINVTDKFPANLTGKPIEIKVKLNKTYFDKFPGYETDPIPGYHKYNVEIPSIYIAVPDEDGKVYYTTCRASDLNITFIVGVDWKIDGIKYISKEEYQEFSNATQQENSTTLLNEKWDELENRKNISYSETILDQNYKKIKIDGIKEEFENFPKKTYHTPDISEAIIIARSSISQLIRGTIRPITEITMNYLDWIEKSKKSTCIAPTVEVTGAWLELTYSRKLVEYLGDGKYAEKTDQSLYPDESGLMKVQFKLTNTGNGDSYNTKYAIILEPNLNLFDSNAGTNKIETEELNDGRTKIFFDYGSPILAKELKGGILYLNYSNICDSYEILTQEEKDQLPKALNITKESEIYMDLTETQGENSVVQHLRTFLSMDYSYKNDTSVYIHLDVTGRRKDPTNKIKPKIKYNNLTSDDLLMYIGKLDETEYDEKARRLEELGEFQYETIYNKGPVIEEIKDKPIQRDYDNKNHKVSYTINIYDKNTNKLLNSNKITYEQSEIGLSKAEVILIIISVVFYVAAIFFIWLGIRNCRKPVDLEKTVYKSKLEKLVSFG